MPDGPVQLVQLDDAGRCHLQEPAVALLNEIRGKVAVVGVAGICRTGKSFLLNRLMGSQEGFEVGPSVNPCTKGLWIWGRPVQLGPDLQCLFLDTEGLGSTHRTASCDMQIFSLCVLLSSLFIYNSLGAIDEQAVEDLNLVLHLAEHIHVKSGGQAESRAELARHFPALLWVLRDFFLRLVDERGGPITETEYLERALRPIDGQEDKNKVRGAIREFFPQRDCATLARPVADEGDLRAIQRLPYEALRPRFREQLEALVRRVRGEARPKLVAGAPASGATLAALAAEYCSAINRGAVPSIQSAWASAAQQLLRERRREALRLYRELLAGARAAGAPPVEERRLRELHDAAAERALAALAAPGLDASDAQVQECRAELEHCFGRIYEQARAENFSASARACEQLAAELYDERISRKLETPGAYGSIQELMADWTQLREAYAQLALGPAQAEVSSSWIFQRMSESVQRLWADLQRANDEQLGQMVQQVREAEARSEDASGVLEAERRSQRELLEAAQQQWSDERAGLATQLEDARSQLEASPALPPPSVPAHVASAMALHLWRRARSFACRALHGLPCRVVDRASGEALPARLCLAAGAAELAVEELPRPAAAGGGAPPRRWRCGLLELRNVWLCADSELACLVLRALRRGAADAGRVLLLDGPPAPLGLVVHSSQAREDLLDGLAVLIAVQRSQREPELVERCSPGGLRPPGLSLQSLHIAGPICGWLARAGDGGQLLVSPESRSETQLALREAAEALGMGDAWRSAER